MESGRTIGSPLPGRLSRNTVTLAVSSVGGAALSFVLSALIGRALGQDGLGVYATALAWVLPLSLVAEFGIGTLITRDLAINPAAAPVYLRAAVFARLTLGGSLTLLLALAAPLVSPHPAVARGVPLAAPLVLILPFFSLFSAVFRARQAMWPIPWLNIGMLAAQVALTAAVFAAGGDVLAALAVNTLTSAGQLVAAWWVWRRWFAAHPSNNPLPGYREGQMWQVYGLLRRAWPFALAAVLAALQLRLNAILLERLTTTGEAGYYAAAARFAEAGRVIPNALFGALFPALAALAADECALERTFRRVMPALAAFGAALALVVMPLAGVLLNLTYGENFTPAAPVLVIAMWGLLFALLRGGRTLYWYARGREQFTNAVTAITLALQVALALWFIPAHGAVGAALAGLLTEAAALLLLWRPKWFSTTHRYTPAE
ncbi:MAG: oligosaccharide flippase family protein [Chloroflexi bacterium]|nr:oligosaccharide flippase family protein [Chloroflexota bacterium]